MTHKTISHAFYPERAILSGLRCAVPCIRLCLCLVLLLGFMAAPPALAAESDSIGKVSQFKAGAFVERNGKTRSLTANLPVLPTDILKTNASGRVTVLFKDDSTVSIGPNSRLDMSDYAEDAPSANPFSILGNIATGISGAVTKKNPEGFKEAKAPEGTVGVRGLEQDEANNGQGAEKSRTAAPLQLLEDLSQLKKKKK